VLVGKKVVFTGKMNGSRDKMKKKAKSIGIKVLVSVSAKTDYLVVGDNVELVRLIRQNLQYRLFFLNLIQKYHSINKT
jgi:BRCT domain type II-containing protein